jgi:outer membrane protein assembly factor BamB
MSRPLAIELAVPDNAGVRRNLKSMPLRFGAVAPLVFCPLLAGADWPQFRGPERNGVSKETGLLKEWPKAGPKLLWQLKEVGYGYAIPSVAGNRIYLVSNNGLENEYVQALSTEDGKQIWSVRLGNVGNPKQAPLFPAARSTPTVDGNLVYVLGSDGDLLCLETADGKVVWRKNLRTDFGGKPGQWAYAESPLVDGNALVVTPGGAESTIVALNKKTGTPMWKCAAPGGDDAAYSSIMITEAAGHKQYVQFLGKGVVGVDAASGEFLWRYDATGKGVTNIPSPVVQDGYIYTSAGRGPGALVKLTSAGQRVAVEQIYLERGLPNAIGGSVLVAGTHYGTLDGGLVAADWLTGKVLWQDASMGAGSILYADERLYIHSEDNELILVDASKDSYRERGRLELPDPPKHTRGGMEKSWAYPVLANGRLYVRDLGSLWCYDVSNK